ncbi:endonuclease III [Persephonella sp.]
MKKKKITEEQIIEGLKKHYPDPWIDLNYSNPYELLVATILAAQATDKKVNQVTETFFKKYPDPESLANAPLEQIENDIKQINFYKRKAKLLKECCEAIVRDFNGKIPDNIDDLVKLPGVGRKTASVLLVNAFNKPAIVVDTHVKRVSQRLGITKSNNPDKIEKDLAKFFKKENWVYISKAMVLFGRYICKAKNPKCSECALLEICPYEKKNLK